MHTLEQLRSGALAGVRRLDLSAGLRTLPPEVFELADTLEVLNLSGNQLTHLPDDLPRLHRLRVVFGSYNPFTELPEVLGQCPTLEMVGFRGCRMTWVAPGALAPSLRALTLTDNCLTQLPAAVGTLPRLQKLMLTGNGLTDLPDSLAQAQSLELLRIAANRLGALPAWLTQLPRLAWLAVAGNPGVAAPTPDHPPACIDWSALTLGPLLGEGTSGRIYQASWQPGHTQPARAVAVKIFKATLSSDGQADSEMAVMLGLSHPRLSGALALLSGHPEGALGLVMPLLPAQWCNLAQPPSLDSCTRDVYAPGFRPGLAPVLTAARQVAEAGAHLHQRGMLHGDLYAHNVLWQPDSGQAMLTDMGAAAMLHALPTHQQRGLQALEVRAWGWLLDELLSATGADGPAGYRALREACLRPNPAERPSLAEVAHSCASLGA